MCTLACALAASILDALLLIGPIFIYAQPQITTPAASLVKGFQVSPSQISLQWGSLKPFLESSNGNFALGFYGAGGNDYILALMYTVRSTDGSDAPLNMEMIWSANHDSPNKEDAIFAVSEQGNLLLSDASKSTQLWSTGTASTGPSKLFIEDSGNLVLSSTSNISSVVHAPVMWQSFDHPTDTLLSDQNFTANMRLVTSLHTASNIQASVFLKIEVDGIALYADFGGQSSLMYWKLEADQETAVIDPHNSTIYARMHRMGYLGMYANENNRVSYEVFDTYNSTEHRRLKLDSDGNLRVYYWANTSWHIDFEAVQDPCSLPSACGPYGICNMSGHCLCATAGIVISSTNLTNAGRNETVSFERANASDAKQGCVLENAESFVADDCTSGKPDNGKFVQLVGMDSLFHDRARASPNASSVEECEGLCRADCTCTAFFYNKGAASKCFLAYEPAEHSMVQSVNMDNLAFIKLSTAAAASMAPYKALSDVRASAGRDRRQLVPGLTTAVIASALVIGLLCAFAVYRYRRRRPQVSNDLEKKAFLSEIPGLPPFVRYRELESCIASSGGVQRAGHSAGNLYEGTLAGGARVAVARLTLVNLLDLHNVKHTLASVGRITHPNLARLCCYSINGPNLALAYELPPNGWLDVAALSWQQRVEVAIGVARALEALHEGKMVHGLLDLGTVLVAGGCEARVSGVGVAELVCSGLASASNLSKPPDLSKAGDVLQYGVVLTELLTGRRIKADFATWRLRWREAISAGRPGQLLDRAVQTDALYGSEDLLLRLATSAGLCLHPSPLQRPSMSTVIRILDGSLPDLPLV